LDVDLDREILLVHPIRLVLQCQTMPLKMQLTPHRQSAESKFGRCEKNRWVRLEALLLVRSDRMRVNTRIPYFVAGALATQLVLGCQSGEQEDLQAVPAVTVPTDLDHPSQLVGKWQEAKGQQVVQLNADGSGEFLQKVSLGANVTRGAAQNFDQKTSTKWGVKNKAFYFAEIKGSGPLTYDWTMSGNKLMLSNSGSKLVYTKVEEKPKP
jgi:uncharacterized protein (DUF2147 family)